MIVCEALLGTEFLIVYSVCSQFDEHSSEGSEWVSQDPSARNAAVCTVCLRRESVLAVCVRGRTECIMVCGVYS